MTTREKGIAVGVASTVAFIVLCAALAYFVTEPVRPRPRPDQPKPAPRPEPTPEERTLAEFIDLHNAFRKSHGRKELARSPELMASAKAETDCNAKHGRLEHTCDGSPWERMERAGYRWRTAAENIAYAPMQEGSAFNEPAREAMIAAFWMLKTEPMHRACMLKSDVTDIGVGMTVKGGYAYFCTDFGSTGKRAFAAAPLAPRIGNNGQTSSVSTDPESK